MTEFYFLYREQNIFIRFFHFFRFFQEQTLVISKKKQKKKKEKEKIFYNFEKKQKKKKEKIFSTLKQLEFFVSNELQRKCFRFGAAVSRLCFCNFLIFKFFFRQTKIVKKKVIKLQENRFRAKSNALPRGHFSPLN